MLVADINTFSNDFRHEKWLVKGQIEFTAFIFNVKNRTPYIKNIKKGIVQTITEQTYATAF